MDQLRERSKENKIIFKNTTDSSTVSFKINFKNNFKGYIRKEVEEIRRITLHFWRDHKDLTGYNANDLYDSNSDGSITKLWIPLPWWDGKNGYYKVLEVCFIYVDNLIPDVKKSKLKEAKDLEFFDPKRVNSWNILFVCNNRAKVRSQFYEMGYVYIIKNDEHALRHVFHFVINALTAVNESIENAAFILKGPAEVLHASKEFIRVLDNARRRDIQLLNEARQ